MISSLFKKPLSSFYRHGIKTACRTLLTESYINYPLLKHCTADHESTKSVLFRFMDFDHCLERGYPATSLMIDRMVNEVSTKEHMEALRYYVYNFRHSVNGYYLRPWTIHNIVEKSMKLDSSIVLNMLTHRAPYGVFPNVYSINLLINKLIKEENTKDSLFVAFHLFLLEMLDNKVSQVLVMQCVKKYWNENCTDDSCVPTFENIEEQRNIAGILYTIGTLTSDTNLSAIGLAMLGKIEKENGILSVFQHTWAPLPDEEGYLERAVDCISSASDNVSQQCLDVVESCLAGDEDFLTKFKEQVKNLQEKNLVSDEEKLSISGRADVMLSQLPKYEADHVTSELEETAREWGDEREALLNAELELRREVERERTEHKRRVEVEEEAHQMAVVELGFYDLERKEKTVDESELKPELRSNYVDGSLNELDIIERMRENLQVEKNPVIKLENF